MSYLDRLRFLETAREGTDRTDTTPVLSVLAVPPGALTEKRAPDQTAFDPVLGFYARLFEGQAARALVTLEPAAVRRAVDLGAIDPALAERSVVLAYRAPGAGVCLIAVPREEYDGLRVLGAFEETTA